MEYSNTIYTINTDKFCINSIYLINVHNIWINNSKPELRYNDEAVSSYKKF